MNKVYVELRDIANEFDNLILEIDPADNQLGYMWFNALQHNLKSETNNAEKNHMLYGWAKETTLHNHPGIRDYKVLCDEMNWSIKQINKEMNTRHGYPIIKMDFNKKLLDDPNLFRDAANEIHHHFELLIGQVWNPSQWWKKDISEVTRNAIRTINNVVHQMEALFAKNQAMFFSLNNVDTRNQTRDSDLVRFPLGQGCYKYFKDEIEPGMITDYYCQLGKRHVEAYLDNDDHIDRTNVSGTRYVTGEFIISIYGSKKIKGFRQWLINNDFDPDDITQGYGKGVLGYIKDFDAEELVKRNDIYKVTADDGYIPISKTFNYTWKDEVLKTFGYN